MQTSSAISRIVGLAFAIAGGVGLSGCTSTTGFTSLSNQTVPTAAKVTETSPESAATLSVPAVTTPTAPLAPVPATQIAGIPAPVVDAPAQVAPTDSVAIPKPVLASASAPASSPEVIRTVPRTPVVNRPTNQIMMVRTTAYTHSESDHVQYGRKSAAGNTLKYGSQVRSAAADWSKYPLGTRFMIEGLPYEYVVDDYGSALVGTETIDIYKPEKGTMNKWGVRNVPIRVLEWGSFEESRRILDERKHVRHADHVREMLREIEKKARKGDAAGVNKA
jgi:3D (Asp-Asp-Asp) domain-containing protein